MKDKNVWGGLLASIAAAMGIIGHPLLFMEWYQKGMHAETAEPEEAPAVLTPAPVVARRRRAAKTTGNDE